MAAFPVDMHLEVHFWLSYKSFLSEGNNNIIIEINAWTWHVYIMG